MENLQNKDSGIIPVKKILAKKNKKNYPAWGSVIWVTVAVSFLVSSLTGLAFGVLSSGFAAKYAGPAVEKYLSQLPLPSGELSQTLTTVREESAVVEAVKKVSPAVVSIIVTKDLPKVEKFYGNPFGNDPFFNQFFGQDFSVPQYEQKGTEKQEIGGGTGFIVSTDGLIATNSHVVEDTEAEYTVLNNEGVKIPAQVLGRASGTDLAILKIDPEKFFSAQGGSDGGKNTDSKKPLAVVELGDSNALEIGQSVIAIGNALGEFSNTVSVGVVSGLSRSITASGGLGGGSEQLSGIIQTDAAINPGNSGGPLLNIKGQVIGINVAMAQGAQSIGFAIPINDVKKIISDVQKEGRIVQPFMGVRYVLIDKNLAKKNNLPVDYGALIARGETFQDLAIVPGSPADKAGLAENDIVLEINGTKIDENNTLAALIGKYNVGDEIKLKVLHKGQEKEVKVTLEERKS